MTAKNVLKQVFLLLVFLFFPGKIIQFVALFFFLIDVLSFIWSKTLEKKLTITRNTDEFRIHKNGTISLSITIYNYSRLYLPNCFVQDVTDLPGKILDDARFLFSLKSKQYKRLNYKVQATKRGYYKSGPIIVKASDPFNLYPFEKKIALFTKVIVWPAQTKVANTKSLGIPLGNIKVKNPAYEDMTVIRSTRDYTAGDEIRKINWKSTARFGKLITNEFLQTKENPLFVFADFSYERFPEKGRRELLENLVEVAGTLIRIFQEQKQACGFSSATATFKIQNKNHIPILDFLAGVQLEHEANEKLNTRLSRVQNILPNGASLIFIGNKNPAKIKQNIKVDGKIKTANIIKKFSKISECVYEQK